LKLKTWKLNDGYEQALFVTDLLGAIAKAYKAYSHMLIFAGDAFMAVSHHLAEAGWLRFM